MKLLLLIFFISAVHAANNQKQSSNLIDEAEQFVNAFISSTLNANSSNAKLGKFSTQGCIGKNSDWVNLFMHNRSFTHDYKFANSCDIQGRWRPTIGRAFPANFAIRKLGSFNKVNMKFTIKYKSKMPPYIVLNVTDGILFSPKGKVHFSANYEFLVDLMQSLQTNKIKAQKHGGIMTFHSIFGKNTSIQKEILISY